MHAGPEIAPAHGFAQTRADQLAIEAAFRADATVPMRAGAARLDARGGMDEDELAGEPRHVIEIAPRKSATARQTDRANAHVPSKERRRPAHDALEAVRFDDGRSCTHDDALSRSAAGGG